MNELYEQLERGNRYAWKQLSIKQYPNCKWTVISRGGSEADARSVFNKALEILWLRLQRDDLAPVRNINDYLFRICKNEWTGMIDKSEPVIEPDPNIPTPVTEDDREKKWSLIHDCMDNIGEDCRELLALSFFVRDKRDRLNDREIAEALYMEYKQVRQRRYQCMQRIMKCVKSKL